MWLSETPSGQAQGTFERREIFKNLSLRPVASTCAPQTREATPSRGHLWWVPGRRLWEQLSLSPTLVLLLPEEVSVRTLRCLGDGNVCFPCAQFSCPRKRGSQAGPPAKGTGRPAMARVGPGTPGQARGPGAWLSLCLSLVLHWVGWGAAAVNCELRLHGKRGVRGET